MNETYSPSVEYPRRALRASLYLLAVECLMLAFPSGNWFVLSGLFLWGASRWWTIQSGWCMHSPALWNAMLFAVVFSLKFAFLPASFPSDAGFANTELSHEIGCFLVTYQILILHEPRSLKRIPPLFAALGSAAILCAGNLQLHSISRGMMLVLMIMFVGGLGWFAHAGRNWIRIDQQRRWRRGLMLATLAFAVVPTVLAAQAWHRHERDLEAFLIHMMRMLDGSRGSLRNHIRSPLIQVSNGKIHDPELPVLKVIQSSNEPLYFRGVTFDLQPSRIGTRMSMPRFTQIHAVRPRQGQGLPIDRTLFEVFPSTSTHWISAQIEYLSREDPVLLAPLNTSLIDISVNEMRRDPLMNLSLAEEELPSKFTCYVSPIPELTPRPDAKSEVRTFGNPLDPRVQELADRLFQGLVRDDEKIAAVTKFFHENFRYELGFEPPRREDPITYFLLNRPAAHCEYFATGAAILLRAGGVATRYITGYVPSERHPDGSWIARRKDAHAWVEAFDSDLHCWVTVEATPSVGQPEQRRANWIEALRESWRQWRLEIIAQFQSSGLWSTLASILKSPIVRGVLVFGLIAAWWFLSPRRLRRRIASETSGTDREFPLRRWLFELESDLTRRGLTRRPNETLLQFRERILSSPDGETLRPAANWYAEYSSVRYNELVQSPDRLSTLEKEWKTLQSNLRLTSAPASG